MKFSKIFAKTFLCLPLLFAFLFFGCAPDVGTLSDKELADIKNAYFEMLVEKANEQGNTINADESENITVLKYLGTYNGFIVIKLRNLITPGPAVVEDVVIDGITIGKNIDASVSFYAYEPENKEFTVLSKAYELGYIGKDDLKAIASAEKST